MSKTSASQIDRSTLVLGDLPDGFLRVDGEPSGAVNNQSQAQQVMNDYQTAQLLQAQQFTQTNACLIITILQAKLVKNYGLTKMDPYCRLRIGHSVFETPTAHNGAKNPRWNKTLTSLVNNTVDSVYIEIFDERAFTVDERVAWAHVPIPQSILSGNDTNGVEDWYPLSGKQGEEKEGMINLHFQYSPAGSVRPAFPQQPMMIPTAGGVPVMMVPAQQQPVYPMTIGGAPVTVLTGQPTVPLQQQQQQQQIAADESETQPQFTQEDIKQLKEMFPTVEETVIQSLLEANRGNKDTTINNLLQMET